MEAFPAFFPLKDRRVVIAGEGEGAEAKARLLAGSPAQVDRIAGDAALTAEAYAGAVIAFVASPDAGFCEQAARAARTSGAAVNVVDHPELSDFHTPGIIDRGQVIAAIGTGGAAPIVAALLRAELEGRIAPGLGRMAVLFGQLRPELVAAFPDLAQRRAFLRGALTGEAARAADGDDMAGAERALRAEIDRGVASAGRTWLIEAPAQRDLLSLRAARVLAEADNLVLAESVDGEVAVLARRDAPRRSLAGIEAAWLAAEAAAGRQTAIVGPRAAMGELATRLDAIGAPYARLAPGA
jgi:precorrin-2 dehydrogenase/sirohydrochlorin ferrochelatase